MMQGFRMYPYQKDVEVIVERAILPYKEELEVRAVVQLNREDNTVTMTSSQLQKLLWEIARQMKEFRPKGFSTINDNPVDGGDLNVGIIMHREDEY